ncbi:bifunctional nuclease family protein [Halorhodospira halophila]
MGFAGLAQAEERELAVEPEDMVAVEVTTLALEEGGAPAPVVLLGEPDSERVVPIFIGPAEAQAIHDALHGVEPPRPMTHDLFGSVLRATGYSLEAVYIDAIVNGAYVAALALKPEDGDAVRYIDSRSSDAIALALRAEATIYAAPEVLEAAEEREQPRPQDESLRMTRLNLLPGPTT